MTEQTRDFLCEVCGKTATMTDEAAFQDGWDYPPRLGIWGIVSPRTCGDCPMDQTAWWALTVGKVSELSDLSERHQTTVKRINAEKSG